MTNFRLINSRKISTSIQTRYTMLAEIPIDFILKKKNRLNLFPLFKMSKISQYRGIFCSVLAKWCISRIAISIGANTKFSK